MTQQEKRKKIKEYWEANIKGDDRYHHFWRTYPKTFVSWALRVYQEGAILTRKDKDGGFEYWNMKFEMPGEDFGSSLSGVLESEDIMKLLLTGEEIRNLEPAKIETHETEEAETAPKKRRGRPKGSKNKK